MCLVQNRDWTVSSKHYFLAQNSWKIQLPQTTIGGPWINGGRPLQATIALYLANEDAWIVGLKEGMDLKMVKLKVTGANSFNWISSKYKRGSSCETSFSEACFTGTDVQEDKYQVQLVANHGK